MNKLFGIVFGLVCIFLGIVLISYIKKKPLERSKHSVVEHVDKFNKSRTIDLGYGLILAGIK